ncbi:conjugative transposon protein TraK [Galbibacter sp. EGI 63066]|uniref:conjugative transposon protein TraK n=1 Tax=Galbibacter sp. EGI 63066 TaxID=2993559 RepID=UPI002248A236|nr:conjugative transposon protein TraK [Galbibacter sp. EGI 63066]MCX2680992.1 conjugative transposon protein TraK [Galbibacter sp. EGI 63066]
MFEQLKNIDTAYKHIKTFSLVWVIVCGLISCFAIYQSFRAAQIARETIYVLAGGKAIEAFSAQRKDNIPVEARDHVKMFHHYFFTLDPDDKVIEGNLGKALYMADASARDQYNNLKENGYYNGVISGNISQGITADSIRVSLEQYPYYFRYYGTQKITRTTTIVTRRLVTEGTLRNVNRSDNNPHGFLIENWKTLENKDIHIKRR